MKGRKPYLLVAALCLVAGAAPGQAPRIDSFAPTSGYTGTPVTITGANFSPTPAENIVYFGAVRAGVTAAGTNSLEVIVPAGATYQPITVTTAGLTGASKAAFLLTFAGSQFFQTDGFLDHGTGLRYPGVLNIGDLDGDGRPEVVTFSFTGNGNFGGLLLFHNTSTPGTVNSNSFEPEISLYPTSATDQTISRSVAIADLDGDGKLDLVLKAWNPAVVVIYRNISATGSLTAASFADPVLLNLNGIEEGLAVADLDGDGRPDIVVANNGVISVFHNVASPGNLNSNSFAPPVDFPVAASSIVTADFDLDGKPDIAALTSDGVTLLRNISTGPGIDQGTFADPVVLSISPPPFQLVVGDVDGDGRADILTLAASQSTITTILRNVTSGPGLGTNSFAPKVEIPSPYFQSEGFIGIGDLNGDGKVDLVLLAPKFNVGSADSFSVLINQGSPGTISADSFAPAAEFTLPDGYTSSSLALADVDGDGKTDILFPRRADNGLYSPKGYLTVYHNGTPSPPNVPPTVNIVSPTNGAAFTAPASITITAEASDSDGSVAHVLFQSGKDVLGVSDTAPYTFTWTNLAAGNYTVTAKAIDNLGGSTTSAPVTMVVNPVPLPPVISAQPQSQSVGVGSNATFSVTATGTAPLSFQWLFNGTNIVDATTSTLTLTNVQFANAGEYSASVSNAASSVTSASATLTVVPIDGRLVHVADAIGFPASMVTVPISLVGHGNENAVGFSINFPTSVLAYVSAQLGSGAADAILNVNANQAALGRLGISLALSAGNTFPPGTQELAMVTFNVASGLGNTTATISFGDQPLAREISDPLANSLRASYLGGTVAIGGGGFEGDVTPLPDGNGLLTVTDWVKVGRYAAGLDAVPSPTQFQKADCAPRSTLGNGAITITDWVQAGRYAAGLDPLTPAGGPTAPTGAGAAKSLATGSALGASSREVRLPTTGVRSGQTSRVPVLLVAQGNESAVGFSLSFDASLLTFVGASAGTNAAGAILNVNTSQVATGRLGLALSLPIGSTFAMGTQEMAALRFAVASNAIGSTEAKFSDDPVTREVSDALAISVAAAFVNGTLQVLPALRIRRAGADTLLAWPAWASNFLVEATQTLPATIWNAPSATGTNVISGEIHLTVPGSAAQRFFRLRLP